MKNVPVISLCLIFAGIALAACQSRSALEQPPATATNVPSPAPTPTEEPTPVVLEEAIPAVGLIINQDPPRSSLFNINTLAYGLPGMDQVEVTNFTYAFLEDKPLTLDIYYPPGVPEDAELPVVIFGIGYRMSREPLRNAHFYTSWGKLVAAAGMAGIVYDTEQPDRDLEIVMAFIQENAADLQLDPARIGLMSTSSNVPTVLSYLMQKGRDDIRFSIYYYGLTLTPDHKFRDEFGKTCEARGCLLFELADVTYVDPGLPILVAKAGQDKIPDLNEAMDHFIEYVRSNGAPVTVLEYEDGGHGFDTLKTDESADIIAQTLQFMVENFGHDGK